MKTCENCGCRVDSLGCVNCNEMDYIDQQAWFDMLAEAERKSDFPQPSDPPVAHTEQLSAAEENEI